MQDPVTAASSNAAALKQMGFAELIQHFDTVGWIVFVTLIIMSLGSVYYTVVNFIRIMRTKNRGDQVVREFWAHGNTQEAIRYMEDQPAGEAFSNLALDAAEAAAHHQRESGRLTEALSRSEFVDRALRLGVARESQRLESGQTWLATSGAAAPFVGLLGTVWGIYHALIRIGATGQASIDAVAGPVGEALIMTAIGLFVAIPALFAYNFFTSMNKGIYAKFDSFAHDLHDYFATGSRVGDTPPSK